VLDDTLRENQGNGAAGDAAAAAGGHLGAAGIGAAGSTRAAAAAMALRQSRDAMAMADVWGRGAEPAAPGALGGGSASGGGILSASGGGAGAGGMKDQRGLYGTSAAYS
ncbi:hypothetical protein MNEG_15922, partial [Monoraphidium neglectum]